MNTLILTAEEQQVFAALPEKLKEGWEVQEERSSAYESAEELAMRQQMASFAEFPQLQSLARQVTGGEPMAKISLKDLPEGLLPEFCFTIGARGLSSLIGMLLRNVQNDEDVEGLMGLSTLRHAMLQSNASVPSAI